MLKSHAAQRVAGLMYRQLILYWRHLDRKFEIFFWPTVDAIMFGAIGRYAAHAGNSDTLGLMLVGFVMAQVVWQAHIHLSKFFLQETWDRNVLYIMTRPLRVSEILTASVGLSFVVAVSSAVFIALVIATVFGLHLLAIPPAVILLIPILMVLGWSTGLLATSLVVRLGQKADNFVWAIFGLIGPLSGSIVPISTLPAGLRHVAELLPTTYAYEAGRAIVFGHGFPAGTFAVAGAGACLLFALATVVLARSVRTFRNRGYISRYV